MNDDVAQLTSLMRELDALTQLEPFDEERYTDLLQACCGLMQQSAHLSPVEQQLLLPQWQQWLDGHLNILLHRHTQVTTELSQIQLGKRGLKQYGKQQFE
jgi:hypothetical protein